MPTVNELLNDKKSTWYPRMLILGPLGTGKTAFVGQGGPGTIMFDMDKGFRTMQFMKDKWTELRHSTDVFVYHDADSKVPTAFNAARKHVQTLYNLCKSKPAEAPKLFILDSFTGLVKAAKEQVLGASGKSNPTLPEWGLIISEIEGFLQLVSGLRCIQIICGHEMAVEDASGMTLWRLLCPGRKLPDSVAGFFDDVFRAKIKSLGQGKTQYMLTSKPTPATICRTRSSFTDDWPMDEGLWPLLEKIGYISDDTKK